MRFRSVGWAVVGLAILFTACNSSTEEGGEDSGTSSESNQPNGTGASDDGKEAATPEKRMKLEAFREHDEGVDNTERKSFFSFAKGTLMRNGEAFEALETMKGPDKAAELEAFARDAYDIFFDSDHGIATNSEIGGWELGVGNGGIIDMGPVGLDEVKEAPANGYKQALDLSEIKQGHTYCVRTANGTEYGKFHILDFDQDDVTLEATWAFQAGGSRQFE